MRQHAQIIVNTVSNWLGIFTSSVVLIFLAKFLLGRLREDQFGMLRYVITIQGSLMFLDLGLGVTLNRFVSRLTAVDDMIQLKAIISSSLLLFSILGVLAAIIMVGLGLILPLLVTGCEPELYKSGLILMTCIGSSLMVRFWGYGPKGILFGLQQHFIVNIILTVALVLRALAITVIFITMNSAGLVAIGLCFLGGALIETALMWIFAKSRFPEMKFELRNIERSIGKKIFGFSIWVTLLGLTTVLLTSAPTLLAGWLFGPTAVAFISLPLLILSQLQRISGGFGLAIIPVAGKYGVLGNKSALQQIMTRSTKFCAIMCFPLAMLAVVFALPLLGWFKEGFEWTWALLAIMALPIAIRATQRISSSVLMGAGSVKGLALGQIVVVLMIGFLSWTFAVHFDLKLYGIALGSAIPILFYDAVYKPMYACRQVGLKWLSYVSRSYGRVLVGTIPAAIVAVLLVRYAFPGSLIMIVLESLICLVIFGISAWSFILMAEDRLIFINLLRRKRTLTNSDSKISGVQHT